MVCLSLGFPTQAATISVSGTSVVTGGLLAVWVHTYTGGAPGLQIEQISIDLGGTGLIFDTVTGGPGALLGQGIGSVAGAALTGYAGATPSNGALDGQTLVTLSFTNFGAGEAYSHTGDVDQTVSCAGLGTLATVACITANATNTGPELAGIQLWVTLGGPGYVTTKLPATFAANGLLGSLVAQANWSGEVTMTPEPGTWAVVLVGLGAVVLGRRRGR
ncbi:MAG: PEP-CTERM sorting domain-containing protein [Bryobacterales bacterium]|nr:PEP-CTERM sorting domain-containing protein [Bryobacterales bacterium]